MSLKRGIKNSSSFICFVHQMLMLCCLLLFGQTVLAQVGSSTKRQTADRRVKAALDEIGYKYELTEAKDYRLNPLDTEQVGTKSDGKPLYRYQTAYVNSNTERYVSLEIREVWSPAFYSSGPLSAALANRLLRENNSVKFGAWRVDVEETTGKYLVIFAAQIAADSDAETLRLTIKSVVLIADRMEKELSGTDDY